PDPDTYAPETGYAGDFPAARDPKAGRAWLTHCYGAVGAARGQSKDSGSGSSLYVVIGHAPRHLDRNVTLVGRVVKGMEVLYAQTAERFGALRRPATAGELERWLDAPRGRLAAIILIDQFSRNLFRGDAESFRHDPLARRWTLEGLARGDDAKLRPIERVFFYL